MENLVAEFRAALDQINWATMPIGFKNFPSGTCGDISDILAEHLYLQGIENIEYVCGKNENGTHAWLEIDGFAVDVTADQFDGITDRFLIQSPKIWHSIFEERDRRTAGYKNMHGPAISVIMQVHNEINRQLNA